MRLAAPEVTFTRGRVRTLTTIEPDDPSVEPFELYFEVSSDLQIDNGPAPFAPLALTLAAWYGEHLLIDGPLPRDVETALHRAAPVLARFYRRPVSSITAVGRAPVLIPRELDRSVGLFFSRGVDSSWLAVANDAGEITPRGDVSLVVEGIGWFSDATHAAVATSASVRTSESLGLAPWVIRTNAVAQSDAHGLHWPWIHGGALFGIAYLLRAHLRAVLIASAGSEARTRAPFGSHPDLDRLFSIDGTDVHHVLPGIDRVARIGRLVDDGRALDWLRVCWREPVTNCGTCRKCVLTALVLEAFGALDSAGTFPARIPSVEDLRTNPPGAEFAAAAQRALEPHFPVHAAALDRSHGAPYLEDTTNAAPALLHAGRSIGQETPRPLDWVVIGDDGPGAARTVGEVLRRIGGSGLVLLGGDLSTPVRERVFRSTRRAFWFSSSGELDRIRIIEALRCGARPVIIVPEEVFPSILAALPEPMAPLVTTVVGLESSAREDASVYERLITSILGGGSAWTTPPLEART